MLRTPHRSGGFRQVLQRDPRPARQRSARLSDFTFSKCSTLDGSDPVFYAVANLEFPDLETMQSGLKSPEMGAAGKDVANFATGTVDMYVQEVVSVL